MWMKGSAALVLMVYLISPVHGQVPGAAAPAAAPTAAAPAAAAGAGQLTGMLGNLVTCGAICKERFCASPIGQLMTNMFSPVSAMTGGLIGPCCPSSLQPTAAGLAAPADSPAGAAARIKADEAAAKARREDVRYLGTVDCRYWPEATEALVAALRADRNECVRLEAALALARGCCCNKATLKALTLTVNGSDEDGNPAEGSDRVRAAAAMALEGCLARLCVEFAPIVAAPEAGKPGVEERPPIIEPKKLDGLWQATVPPALTIPPAAGGSEWRPAPVDKPISYLPRHNQNVESHQLGQIVARAQLALEDHSVQSAKPAGGVKEEPAVQKAAPAVEQPALPDGGIVKTSCPSCGGGIFGGPGGPGYCSSCGVPGQCIPGRLNCCSPYEPTTCCGRFLYCLYQCVCCPDPCYDPHWIILADSAFFVDAARPVTQMRLRWDSTLGIPNPDRAEYFFARSGGKGKGPDFIARKIDIEEFSLYNEAAVGRFSAFVEMPYRNVDSFWAPANNLLSGPPIVQDHSGFADMNVGTKSLLLDCELLQIAFQFKTYIPIGSAGKGLGNGHVSLEPALLFGLKLGSSTYLQAETAYWIPIGGDGDFQGNVYHSHFSLNQLLCCILPDVQLVGTLELSHWAIMNGNYTSPTDGLLVNATSDMISGGPGIRLNVCNKIDFGIGTHFPITGTRWADEQYRAEFRWRF